MCAEREIKQGEEICIRYIPFNELSEDRLSNLQNVLKKSWKFNCPLECECHKEEHVERLNKSRSIYAEINTLIAHGDPSDKGIKLVEDLLKEQELFHASSVDKQGTHYNGYRLALAKKDWKLAKDYLEKVNEVLVTIFPPASKELLKIGKEMDDLKQNLSSGSGSGPSGSS